MLPAPQHSYYKAAIQILLERYRNLFGFLSRYVCVLGTKCKCLQINERDSSMSSLRLLKLIANKSMWFCLVLRVELLNLGTRMELLYGELLML
jgi:hypothetical protein